MEKFLAVYLRLSLEDRDKSDSFDKDESDSISNQRALITRYIEEHEDLHEYKVVEYIDDGYSGTNFDRPAVKRMLSDIQGGKVHCVIVKDLSRFGRNYLEVGDYLEHIFPFLRIRFIAINDYYDSNEYIGTTGGLDFAFKNFIYELYSRDLSKKVKASQHMLMRKGKFVTHCPYGYTKEPGVKHQMVIDQDVAPIVRNIFLWAIEGKKSTEIARMLNDMNAPTPMQHKKLSRDKLNNDAMWSHQAVLRILKDYKYTGAMVNFKCENLTIRAKAQHHRRPDEYVIVEDMHEPIVSHEEFYAANDNIRKVGPRKVAPTDRRDRVYYCGHCGRRLRKTFGSDEYYSCATQMYIRDAVCKSIHWSRTDIEKVLLETYKKQLEFLAQEIASYTSASNADADMITQLRSEQESINRELKSFDSSILKLYQEYRANRISQGDFIDGKASIYEKRNSCQSRLEEINSLISEQLKKRRRRKSREEIIKDTLAAKVKSEEDLRIAMYSDVDWVKVYADGEIQIRWKFDCDFSNYTEVSEI